MQRLVVIIGGAEALEEGTASTRTSPCEVGPGGSDHGLQSASWNARVNVS